VEAIIIVLLIVLLVAVAGAMYYFVRQGQEAARAAQSQMEAQRQEMSARLDVQRQEMNARLDAVQGSVGQSLSSTADTMGRIGEQLGGLGESARRILEIGQDIASLQELLRPPKLRGQLGEMLLEQLLSQVLPAAHYTVQHRFASGETVDAVIRLPEGLVPVDSKFPVESFQRLAEAGEEEERRRLRREFVRAVRARIDEVAKYIRPEEGTLDFALMYVPAENVYYETILGADADLPLTYALDRHVYIVSPNTFYAFLQALVRGLSIVRVEQHAREIIDRLTQTQREFEKFRGEFEVLGGHIGRAKSKYEDVDKMVTRFGERLARPFEAPALGEPPSQLAGGEDRPEA
jgi:DNA recombination protein RmuC